jgi:Flp pilus assembly protein TadG
MTIERTDHAREKGIALVYVGVFLVPLLACTGLAVDLGRGYLVRVALARAVDAAALAAARNIAADSSQAQRAANNIFNANFPAGFLGVSSVQNPPQLTMTVASDGSHIITVASSATVPTTFMRIAGPESLTVAASATATRRLVDMSFVMDRSGSLGAAFGQVKEAAKQFVSYFDPSSDRIALITFSANTVVADPMRSERGFDLSSIDSHIDNAVANGATATAEALYQGWDQLRTVPSGSQSGLRIVLLFTDGSPNSVSGQFQVSQSKSAGTCSSTLVGRAGTIATNDYPYTGNSTTTNSPDDVGLYDTYATGVSAVPPTSIDVRNPSTAYDSGGNTNTQTPNPCIPKLPLRSSHSGSSGAPSGFGLYDPTLPHQRALIGQTAEGYSNHVQNANNAARNLAEIIANSIRSDTSGASKIRIYTLGLGDLLNKNMGAASETGSSILQRIANDPASTDFNPGELDGRYFYAGDVAQLDTAFQAVRDQIVRLTQ